MRGTRYSELPTPPFLSLYGHCALTCKVCSNETTALLRSTGAQLLSIKPHCCTLSTVLEVASVASKQGNVVSPQEKKTQNESLQAASATYCCSEATSTAFCFLDAATRSPAPVRCVQAFLEASRVLERKQALYCVSRARQKRTQLDVRHDGQWKAMRVSFYCC